MRVQTIIPAAILFTLFMSGCGKIYDTPGETHDEPPLITAAESGDIQSINSLLNANHAVDERDVCLWTPLMKAAINGHTDVVKRLIEAGAEIDPTDKGGYTPLLLAASNNHWQTVDYLLDHGASINQVESTLGWTPLIWAAKRGHEKTVRILMHHGANEAIRDAKGKTGKDWADEKGFLIISQLLRKDNKQPSSIPKKE